MPLTTTQLNELEQVCRNAFDGEIVNVPINEVTQRTPSYTLTERNALTPTAGWLIWNSTAAALQVWDGTAWKTVTVA